MLKTSLIRLKKDTDTKKTEKDALEKELEKAKDATPENIQKETEKCRCQRKKLKTRPRCLMPKEKADQVTKKV